MPDNFLVSKQLATKHDRLKKRIEKKKTKSELYKKMKNKLKVSSFQRLQVQVHRAGCKCAQGNS